MYKHCGGEPSQVYTRACALLATYMYTFNCTCCKSKWRGPVTWRGNFGVLVHSRVIEMSPIKNSWKNKYIKYDEGQLSDGKEVCRLISFDVKIWDDIEKLMNREESVSLNNCGVKNRTGEGYEVVLTKMSSVFSSPKKFKIDADMMKKSSEMHTTVSNLEKLEHIEDIQ